MQGGGDGGGGWVVGVEFVSPVCGNIRVNHCVLGCVRELFLCVM